MELKMILFVALGAACGAVLRHFISLWLNPLFSFLDLGTLVANTLGCFIIGLVMAFLLKFTLSPTSQAFLVTGFLGSLTTFSSFAKEIVARFNQESRSHEALLVLGGHLILGLAATIFALYLGSKIFR